MPDQHPVIPEPARNFGPKGLACLRLAALSPQFPSEWEFLYAEACAAYSAKAVRRKMAELRRRGYIICVDYTVFGSLTPKGQQVYAAALAAVGEVVSGAIMDP